MADLLDPCDAVFAIVALGAVGNPRSLLRVTGKYRFAAPDSPSPGFRDDAGVRRARDSPARVPSFGVVKVDPHPGRHIAFFLLRRRGRGLDLCRRRAGSPVGRLASSSSPRGRGSSRGVSFRMGVGAVVRGCGASCSCSQAGFGEFARCREGRCGSLHRFRKSVCISVFLPLFFRGGPRRLFRSVVRPFFYPLVGAIVTSATFRRNVPGPFPWFLVNSLFA